MIIMSDNEINENSFEDDDSVKCSDDVNSDDEDVTNVGWANAIAKILKSRKPKNKKTLVLSKAKKINDQKPATKLVNFEIEQEDGTVKQEKLTDNEGTKQLPSLQIKKKKQLPQLRLKPNVLERDRERTLSKIATKGVVQLFNAVKMQQKDINTKLENAGPLEVNRDKVMKNIDKRAFLDMLMGDTGSGGAQTATCNQESRNKSTWNVLRDDFMMKASLKNWDKQLEQNMEVDENIEYE